MTIDHDDSMLVVLLDDMVNHSLPRVLGIRKNLKQGDVLSNSDVDFLGHLIEVIMQCHRKYRTDEECRIIFSTISHLVYKVVHSAYKNEKAEFNELALNTA
jgi:hypothetical protein